MIRTKRIAVLPRERIEAAPSIRMNTPARLLFLAAATAISAVPYASADPSTILSSLYRPTAPVVPPGTDPVRFTFESGWGSKYMGEGVDLWESPLYYANPRLLLGDAALSSWYGTATDKNKGELKFRFDYSRNFGRLNVAPWYEQSFVFPGNRGIPRPGLKMTWNLTSRFYAGSDCYWQQNDGVFRGYYAAFAGYLQPLGERWEYEGTTRYGYNGGYVRAAPRGSNAQDFNNRIRWHATDCLTVEVFANFSLALSSLRRSKLGDDFYYGIAVRLEF